MNDLKAELKKSYDLIINLKKKQQSDVEKPEHNKLLKEIADVL